METLKLHLSPMKTLVLPGPLLLVSISAIIRICYQNTGTALMSNKDKSQTKATDAAAKDAGFDNSSAFFLSYGLSIWNYDDVKEGRAILRATEYGI